jgi:hypothetical protein
MSSSNRNKEALPVRVRRNIRDEIVKVRALQLLGGVKSSELFKMISAVFRDTGGNAENIFLVYLIRELEKEERKNQ